MALVVRCKHVRVCRYIVALVAAGALAGCSNGWQAGSPSAPPGGTGVTAAGEVVHGEQSVTAVAAAAPAINENGTVAPFGASGQVAAYEFLNGYRVGAGDRLSIRVLGQADLTGSFIVDGAGHISLPLINTIRVAGLNPPQVEQAIAAKLRAGYLRDPSVSVQVTAMRPFYILGEVTQAGSFPYQPGMTAQNAIALGGGYSPRANQQDILLTRKTAEGTNTYKVPVTTQLYPGDIVYVRERWF